MVCLKKRKSILLSTILGFHGLKNPQPSLVYQPQGYGLSLIKFAEQSICHSFVPLQTQEMVGESLNQQHYSSGAIQEPYCISTPLFMDIILNTLNWTKYFTKQLKESWKLRPKHWDIENTIDKLITKILVVFNPHGVFLLAFQLLIWIRNGPQSRS